MLIFLQLTVKKLNNYKDKLINSNYTRYHIELINRSCGGWLVSSPL